MSRFLKALLNLKGEEGPVPAVEYTVCTDCARVIIDTGGRAPQLRLWPEDARKLAAFLVRVADWIDPPDKGGNNAD